MPVHNVFRARSGPTVYTRHAISENSPYSAFKLMIDEKMLRHIQRCTQAEADRVQGEGQWNISLNDLETFIALLYARGILSGSTSSRRRLWSEKWSISIFQTSMPRDTFEKILRFIRFDQRNARSERLKTDKFALISEIWNDFVENCKKAYIPEAELTIDEQLFPTKARCRFTQYMGNKPDKFGIKFWLLAETDSKYLWNAKPYLGRDEQRPTDVSLGFYVVTELVRGLENKGYHVTHDNFFTSLDLCRNLKTKSISMLGTIRNNKRELPPIAHEMGKKVVPRYSTEALRTEDDITLTAYKAKSNKVVLLLSSQHQTVSISDDEKKKPEPILAYNRTKVGVDALDQMAKRYSTKAGTRRWPLATFCNILDLAGINAWILYKKCTGRIVSRRDFLLSLVEEIVGQTVQSPPNPVHTIQASPQTSTNDKKRRQCHNCRNKTRVSCQRCSRMVCGKCVAQSPIFCKTCP